MSIVGGFFTMALVVLYFGVIIFLITLLWRITVALEKIARHQYVIACDVKKIADRSEDAARSE